MEKFLAFVFIVIGIVTVYFFFKFLTRNNANKYDKQIDMLQMHLDNMQNLNNKSIQEIDEEHGTSLVSKLKSIHTNLDLKLLYFDFVYNHIYNELINVEDNSYIKFESYEFDKCLFLEFFINYFKSKSIECRLTLESDLIEFPKLNRHLIIRTSTFKDWQYDTNLYQFYFDYDKENKESLIPKLHSLIISQDSESIVKNILSIEYPFFGNEPVIRKLEFDGHSLISLQVHIEDFSIGNCNINDLDESFALSIVSSLSK